MSLLVIGTGMSSTPLDIVIFWSSLWGRNIFKLESTFVLSCLVLYCMVIYWSCFSQCTSVTQVFFSFSVSWSWEKTFKKNSRWLFWLHSETVNVYCKLITYALVVLCPSAFKCVRVLLDYAIENSATSSNWYLSDILGHIVRYFTGPDFPSVFEHNICLYQFFLASSMAQREKIPSSKKKLAMIVLTNFWKRLSLHSNTQSYPYQLPSIFKVSCMLAFILVPNDCLDCALDLSMRFLLHNPTSCFTFPFILPSMQGESSRLI